ncbi:MAG: hypothetical protein AAF692_09755 [Pseudomonadota bacterium]
MFTEDDLNSAVDAGVLNGAALERLKSHIANERRAVSADEESLRLVHSFNDIFVTLAILIAFFGLGALGSIVSVMVLGAFGASLTSAVMAGAAWGLAEIFTRKRRMAFPSIVLFLTFFTSVFMTFASYSFVGAIAVGSGAFAGVLIAFAAFASAIAAWLHWKRFHVPISIAAIASAVIAAVGSFLFSIMAAIDLAFAWAVLPALVFVLGLGVFAAALAFDASDRERITQRSDIAFWLHLLASPLIVHPVFQSLGVLEGDVGGFGAVIVIALYGVFAAIALIVDRRALLVSALLYVAVALAFLFSALGSFSLTSALSALVIGSGLLTLSIFWAGLRRWIVARMPLMVQAQVPAVAEAEEIYEEEDYSEYGGRYSAH